jgi:hypothetical protein
MAIDAQIVDPTPADWETLKQAAPEPGALESVQERHKAGKAVVMKMTGDAQCVGVIWMERTEADVREMVIGLGVGRNLAKALPWLKRFAKDNHAATIRTHTKIPQLIAFYKKNGFENVGKDPDGFTILRCQNGR